MMKEYVSPEMEQLALQSEAVMNSSLDDFIDPNDRDIKVPYDELNK